jgi:drug/metabolite transporter (DMT)-like permease
MNSTEIAHKPIENSATWLGIIACIIWSSAVAVTGILSKSFGTLRACGLECILAGFILLAINHFKGELAAVFSHSFKYYQICGLFWSANLILFWLAVGATTSPEQLVIVGAINYLWPIMTLVFSIFILNHKYSRLIYPSILISLIGIVGTKLSIANTEHIGSSSTFISILFENLIAYTLSFLCAVSWALYSNYTRVLNKSGLAGGVPIFFLFTGLVILIASFFVNEARSWDFSSVIILLIWSFSTGLAYLFWDIGMKKGNMITVSSVSMLTPLFSALITCMLGGVQISLALIAACILSMLGSALCRKAVSD